MDSEIEKFLQKTCARLRAMHLTDEQASRLIDMIRTRTHSEYHSEGAIAERLADFKTRIGL